MLDNFLNGRTYDWDNDGFRNGFSQDYNVSVSGASEKVNYYLAVGYLRNEGIVRGDNYRAFRVNMKINGKITDWLEIGQMSTSRTAQTATVLLTGARTRRIPRSRSNMTRKENFSSIL